MTLEDRPYRRGLSAAVVRRQPDPRCCHRTERQENLPQPHPSEWE
jgi:hypothetical protein